MLYALLFSLLFAGSGISYAEAQTDSLELVDTAHPESFTAGEPDTVSFTFNKAIDTTAHFPGTGPLGFWRIIPVDSAAIDSIWVSEDLKTISYRVEHKSRSDYTWLLENARAKDSTYLKQPYQLYYKLRSGNVNRFSVSGTVVLASLTKRESEFEAANQNSSRYIYYIVALSTKKPTEDTWQAYDPDSVKYLQHKYEFEYEIDGITPGTYWPVLLHRQAWNEDSWVNNANYLTAYDPDDDDRPDSIVVKENNLSSIDIEYFSSSSIEERDEQIDGFKIEAYPNPFNNSTNIEVTVAQPDRYSLAVYDITGRKVKTIIQETQLSRGIHRYHLDMAGLSTGIYNVVVESSTARYARQVSYIK